MASTVVLTRIKQRSAWQISVGVLTAAAALVLMTGVGAARAGDGSGGSDQNGSKGNFNVKTGGGSTAGSTGGGPVAYDPNAYTCVYVDPPADTSGYSVAEPPAGKTAADGRSMNVFCSTAWMVAKVGGSADPLSACLGSGVTCSMQYGVWVPNATPSPAQIAAAAFAKMGLNKPNIHTSPDAAHRLVVSLPTWLWIDGKTGNQQKTVGPITIFATQTVDWSTDEGSVPCTGAGTPYVSGTSDPNAASPDCGYTFTKAGNGKWVKAVVTWRGGFTIGGGAPVAIPTPIIWTVTQPVGVDEVQTVNGR